MSDVRNQISEFQVSHPAEILKHENNVCKTGVSKFLPPFFQKFSYNY